VRFLGVVGRDDNARYFGMAQKLVAQDGQPKTLIDVWTAALSQARCFTPIFTPFMRGLHDG
jgi:hypothetical protein